MCTCFVAHLGQQGCFRAFVRLPALGEEEEEEGKSRGRKGKRGERGRRAVVVCVGGEEGERTEEGGGRKEGERVEMVMEVGWGGGAGGSDSV